MEQQDSRSLLQLLHCSRSTVTKIMGSTILALVSFFLFSIIIPPWEGNDEPMHYEYAEVIRRGYFPSLSPVRPAPWWKKVPDQVYAEIENDIIASMLDFQFWTINEMRTPHSNRRFSAIYRGATAMHQAPLYYLLAGNLLKIVNPARVIDGFYLVRCLSILLWAASVGLIAFMAVKLFGEGNPVAFVPPVMVSLLPMPASNAAAINNDALAVFLSTCVVTMIVVSLYRGARRLDLFIIGALMLPALLAKRTTLSLIPVLLFYLIISKLTARQVKLFLRVTIWILMSVIVILAVMLSLTVSTTLSTPTTESLVVHSPLSSFFSWHNQRIFHSYFFRSFWGTFVWGHHFMDNSFYYVIFMVLVIAGIGLFWRGFDLNQTETDDATARRKIWLVLIAAILSQYFLVYIRFFSQIPVWTIAQGRFLFAMFGPIALLLTAALDAFIPDSRRRAFVAGTVLVLLAFQGAVIMLYVLPHYYMWYY